MDTINTFNRRISNFTDTGQQYEKVLKEFEKNIVFLFHFHPNQINAQQNSKYLNYCGDVLKQFWFNVGHRYTKEPKLFVRAAFNENLHFHGLLGWNKANLPNGEVTIQRSRSRYSDEERYDLSKAYIQTERILNDFEKFKFDFCASATMEVSRYRPAAGGIRYMLYQDSKPAEFRRYDTSKWETCESRYFVCQHNLWKKN